MFRVIKTVVAMALAFVVLAGVHAQDTYSSANFLQVYGRWDAYKNPDGDVYYECLFTARNRDGDVVNKQQLWYFPNAPQGGNTDWSRYWVYWFNPKTKIIWARCPTPHHPQYKEWLKKEGNDLWQVIPEDKRLKGSESIAKAAPLFGLTFSTERTGLPRVQKDLADPITCVNFANAVFN